MLRVRILARSIFSSLPPLPPSNQIDADNTFTGSGEKIEFSDAKDTVWTGNSLPNGTICVSVDSTFSQSLELPDC